MHQRIQSKEWKGNLQNGKKYLQIIYVIRSLKNAYNSTTKTNPIRTGKELRYFPKEDIQTFNRHSNRYSTSLITREIQIKIKMRYHLTPMATTQKNPNKPENKWRNWYLMHCCKMVQLLCKTAWQFLKKLKIEQQLHFWIHIQKYWKHYLQEISAHFIATLIHNSQKVEAIQKSIKDEKICKMWYIQKMEYYLALERKETDTCYNGWTLRTLH